jgi:hypothetical protein
MITLSIFEMAKHSRCVLWNGLISMVHYDFRAHGTVGKSNVLFYKLFFIIQSMHLYSG